MAKSIKIRAKEKGGVVTVKALMNHPMETGLRKDKKTGKAIPAHFINEVVAAYPNFAAVATTLRNAKTATVNDWGAICWHDGELHEAIHRPDLAIFDRVGGGDSFASGLIYGLITTGDAEVAVNYGAAHGALAMTTPGDTTMATMKEVEALMKGASARVNQATTPLPAITRATSVA